MEFTIIAGDYLMNFMAWMFIAMSNFAIRLPIAETNLNAAGTSLCDAYSPTGCTCTSVNCMFDLFDSSAAWGGTYWPFASYYFDP